MTRLLVVLLGACGGATQPAAEASEAAPSGEPRRDAPTVEPTTPAQPWLDPDATLLTHPHPVAEVLWAPGGGRLLTVPSGDGQPFLWDLASEELQTLPAELDAFAFAAADRLAALDCGSHFAVFDAAGAEIHRLDLPLEGERCELRVSADGRRAVIYGGGSFHVVGGPRGRHITSFGEDLELGEHGFEISPDGEHVAFAGEHLSIHALPALTEAARMGGGVEGRRYSWVAFEPSGAVLFAAWNDMRVEAWSTETHGRRTQVVLPNSLRPRSIAVGSDLAVLDLVDSADEPRHHNWVLDARTGRRRSDIEDRLVMRGEPRFAGDRFWITDGARTRVFDAATLRLMGDHEGVLHPSPGGERVARIDGNRVLVSEP